MLEVTELAPLGAVVRGIRVGPLDDDRVGELRDLLGRHGVLIMPDQHIGDAEFLAFLGAFGPLAFTAGETPVPGFGDLNVVSNVGRARPPRSSFHVDTSYVPVPPPYTALRAVRVPERGGSTQFSDQYAAYESLDADTRADVDGRMVTHVDDGAGDGGASARHPLALRHPATGRTALYLSTVARCRTVSGLEDAAGAALIGALLEHSTAAHNVLSHRWRPHDVVMWDNRCVLHRADHDGVVGDRVMHRGMVAG